MKKLISLLLALTMVFSLCACGKSELTLEEKEKIYEEVAAEKAREEHTVLDSDNQDDGEGETASADEIDAKLQGKWEVMNGAVSFDNGEVVMTSGSTSLYGVYEINTSDSTIDLTIKATNGNVVANLPYTYENETLCIYNNNNEPMTKADALKSK